MLKFNLKKNGSTIISVLILLTQICFAQTSPENTCNRFTVPEKRSICNTLIGNVQQAQRDLYSEYNITVPAPVSKPAAPKEQQPPQVIFHPPIIPEQDQRASFIKKSRYEGLKRPPIYKVAPHKQPVPAQQTSPQPTQPSKSIEKQNRLNIYR